MSDLPDTPESLSEDFTPRGSQTVFRRPAFSTATRNRVNDAEDIFADDAPTALERTKVRRSLRGPWVLITGFALMVLIGTLLLKLPLAAAPGVEVSWVDAFFTSTSAITVTGLTVRNTAVEFSIFGQVCILVLLQFGGVGFVTSSVLLFRLIGRRVTLQTRFLVQESIGVSGGRAALRLALYVLAITAAFEIVGALLFWLRWRTLYPDGQALWFAIFQSVSAYCNAGFDLFGATEHGPMYGFAADWYTLTVCGTLIVLGGFGVTILYDLWSYRNSRLLSVNTRFAIMMSVILIALGGAFLMIDPLLSQQSSSGLPWRERVVMGLFTSVSARTAGVTILPMHQLSEVSQVVIMVLMFIGAAPASMAGGVSINTVAVLLTAAFNTASGRSDAVVFGRTLPTETISKAVAIMTVSTLFVAAVTLCLDLIAPESIFALAFETVSAFSNTGYTLDMTGRLDDWSKVIVACTMFWGRLGPLTVVIALAQREQPSLVRYPEEPVLLG